MRRACLQCLNSRNAHYSSQYRVVSTQGYQSACMALARPPSVRKSCVMMGGVADGGGNIEWASLALAAIEKASRSASKYGEHFYSSGVSGVGISLA